MWSWFTRGDLDVKDGDSCAEGIGQTRVTKNLEAIAMDAAYRIPDQMALTIVHHLLQEEGILSGFPPGSILLALCGSRGSEAAGRS